MDTMERSEGSATYDHAAAGATRFKQSTHSSVVLDWRGVLDDCSGKIIGALVHSGWTRYTGGFPESSGDMARFIVERRPDLLLWSWDGRGKYRNLDQALAVRGAIATLNKFLNGDAGHVVALKGRRAQRGGWATSESSSGLHGDTEGYTGRFGSRDPITHVFMIPGVDYGEHTDPTEDNVVANESFFAHTDEAVNLPGAPGQGPGAVWWLLNPRAFTRIHVVSLQHRDWLAANCGVRPGYLGLPDKTIVPLPAAFIYGFNHVQA